MSFAVNTFQKYSNDFGLGSNGVKVTLNYFDALPPQDLLMSLPSGLQLTLKSLLKRDDTTKERALNEIQELISTQASAEQFKDDIFCLCWSQIYAKLVTNSSKSIRAGTHDFTARLIRLLHKKGAKFLKDWIPLLLVGCYDIDTSVGSSARSALLQCFNNSDEKLAALWKVFYKQILACAQQILVVENVGSISDERYVSPEDADMRYSRLAASGVFLLVQLLKNMNDEQGEEDTWYEILSSEALWKLMSLANLRSMKLYQVLLQLQRILLENGYLLGHKDVLKLTGKRYFKTLAQVNTRNLLQISPLLPEVLETTLLWNSYKDGQIWAYDKSFKDRILNLLKLGPGNSSAAYFDYLSKLFRVCEFLNAEETKLSILHKHALVFSERRILTKTSEEQLSRFCSCYYQIVREIDSEVARDQMRDDSQKLISNISLQKHSNLVEAFAQITSPDSISTDLCSLLPLGTDKEHPSTTYADNLLALLLHNGLQKVDILKELARSSLESIENGEVAVNYSFRIFQLFIKNNILSLHQEVQKFIGILPSTIDPSFIEQPTNIMSSYSRSQFLQQMGEEEAVELFSDYVFAIAQLDIPMNSKLTHLNNLDIAILEKLRKEPSETLADFMTNFIGTYDFSTDLIFSSNLLDQHVLKRLYEKALEHRKLDVFSSYLTRVPLTIYEEFLCGTDFLSNYNIWYSAAAAQQVLKSLIPMVKRNGSFARKVTQEIVVHGASDYKHIPTELLIKFASELFESNSDIWSYLSPHIMLKDLKTIVPYIDYRLSLVSPLGVGIHALDIPNESTFECSSARSIISYALFLDKFLTNHPQLCDDDCRIFLALMSELTLDFNCFSTDPIDQFPGFTNSLFTGKTYDFNFADIVHAIIAGESHIAILNKLASRDVSDSSAVYNCRILKRMLLNSIDYTTLNQFNEQVRIEKFISGIIRNTSSSAMDYLYATTIISACSKFSAESPMFVKLRTMLVAELIGKNSTDLVNGSWRLLILLDNILQVETSIMHSDSFQPITPQRLVMFVRTIFQWLDSDVCFEESFSVVRLCLLHLLISMLQINSIRSLGSSLTDLCIRILADSLGFCHLEETLYLDELRFYVLKLHLEIIRWTKEDKNTKDLWEHSAKDLNSELVELCLINYEKTPENHPHILFCSLLSSSVDQIPESYLQSYFDKFMEYLLSSLGTISSVRVVVTTLRKLIIAQQQELVIEYELQKSNLGDGDNTPTSTCKIPPILVSALFADLPEEYLEYEEPMKVIKPLWYWYLVVSYFKNISYNIRHQYIDQLKANNEIDRFFYFVSEQLDMQDTKFWDSVSPHEITEYQIHATGDSPYKDDILKESKLLLVSLLYDLFNNVGAMTSAWWLNIKDRALRSKIDAFVTRYVSPILIDQELEQVSSKIPVLTAQDENLSIRINKITKEIKARYFIDDQNLEISFKLPCNYPLTNIQVQEGTRVGVSEQKWKSWILSTQRVITGMNGSVVDSLELFTKNVRLQFADFEECAICYSILHVVDRKLPSKVCPTCSNRFHGACLYKWFKSSGNNTCPLCRGEIPFRR
ncbi:ABL058Cp [Eremothecium gossypii ATCC 10895]|uniref:E3 ubiquitin-protein ligase listerin n=1 Tax=Eremothecium gossypii (strain ATCC 10895 / CBS 109.51 / FGSC 9923 / NRRL Y-1056) TaxID=284811 RepID=Q75DT4_EREGS|nr:ABL058Cp [Eremothecium gossypii ATCC 10895]AAS50713.2 ABL058Cp [Eremothecium gossypii ATCC 10895]